MNKENNQVLKVAIIGTGYFSQFHYAAWQRMPDVQLVGLLTLDDAQGTEFITRYEIKTRYHSMRELLESDADLIDIVSPPSTHAKFIRECMDKGKAVICQKPFCESVKQAKNTVQYIQDKKGFVAVHENFRFQPWYEQIKQILDSGELGQVYEIHFNFRPGDGQGENAYLDRQPYFQLQPRFFIQETGVHFIDVFRYLIGDVTGLFARLKKWNPAIAGEDGGIVLMEFDNGVRGVLNGNRLSDHKAQNTRLTMGEMRIDAEKAALELNGDGIISTRVHGSNETCLRDFSWQDIEFGGDCVYRTNRHIANHFLHGSRVENLAEEYLRNRVIEDAIYESNRTGHWVLV